MTHPISSIASFEVHTHFNGTASQRHVGTLAQLSDPARPELCGAA